MALLTRLADDRRGQMISQQLHTSRVQVVHEPLTPTNSSTVPATIGSDGQAEYDVAWHPKPTCHLSPRALYTGSVAAFLEPGASTVRETLRRSQAAETTLDPNIRSALNGADEEVFAAFEEATRLSTVVKITNRDAARLYPGLKPEELDP